MYVHQSQEVSISKHLQVATDGARAAAMSSPPLPFLTPPKLSSRASDTTSRSSYLLKRVELAEPGVKQHPGIVLVLHIARLKRLKRNRNILEYRSRRPVESSLPFSIPVFPCSCSSRSCSQRRRPRLRRERRSSQSLPARRTAAVAASRWPSRAASGAPRPCKAMQRNESGAHCNYHHRAASSALRRRRGCTGYAQVSVDVASAAAAVAAVRHGHDRCSSHLHTFTGSYEPRGAGPRAGGGGRGEGERGGRADADEDDGRKG